MRKVLPYLGASLSIRALTWAGTAKAQNPFEDVKPDHWAYQAVTDLQSKGIITGYPDHHFNGQRTLTRYEFAIALKRALDKIGTILGETGFGPASQAVTGMLEGALFAGCVVAALLLAKRQLDDSKQ